MGYIELYHKESGMGALGVILEKIAQTTLQKKEKSMENFKNTKDQTKERLQLVLRCYFSGGLNFTDSILPSKCYQIPLLMFLDHQHPFFFKKKLRSENGLEASTYEGVRKVSTGDFSFFFQS